MLDDVARLLGAAATEVVDQAPPLPADAVAVLRRTGFGVSSASPGAQAYDRSTDAHSVIRRALERKRKD